MDLSRLTTADNTPPRLREFIDSIEYRVARTPEELEKAYYLVYKEYLKRGYLDDSRGKIRASIYNALPQTTTFVSVFKSEIIATATAIPDSPLGLPMDKLYGEQLRPYRENNKKLCEASMLASNTELFKSGISMLLQAKKLFFIFYLFKVIFDYARDILDIDYLCITINPRHRLIYDFLLFRDLGGLKTYESVNGAPAIGKIIDLKSIEDDCKREKRMDLYKMFFTRETDEKQLVEKVRLQPRDLKYFFIEKTDILKKATPDQLKYIESCYPDYDFEEILA